MYTNDYATIKVVTNGRPDYGVWNNKAFDPFDFSMNWGDLQRGDQMKLVPAGFPCTYEKMSASADRTLNTHKDLASTVKQYCGSNYVKATTGDFVNQGCVTEGSIAEGVLATGSNTQNPHQAHDTVKASTPVASGSSLLGYAKLPAAGNYDICFSPRVYRLSLLNVSALPYNPTLTNPVPVWFKLYKASGNCPTTNSYAPTTSCAPRTMVLTTVAATNAITFSAIDTTPGSWGTIMISGSGLSNSKATSWEYSSPREYFTTAGGDQFRIVPDTNFGSTARPRGVTSTPPAPARG
jgi:hypothetical protein